MNRPGLLLILYIICTPLSAEIIGDKVVKILRISFPVDDVDGTTGNGDFLYSSNLDLCSDYTIDPIPHDKSYFESQLKAVDNYFRSVSYGKFGFDLNNSIIFPFENEDSYLLSKTMDYYNPYGEEDLHKERITELFVESIEKANSQDGIEFSDDDLVVIVHAGIGQDFSLPFLDPTPEDIPSTYIDEEMLLSYHGGPVSIGNSSVSHGIIIPETQNHLLFVDVAETMFSGSDTPCEYQFGLTGTFALMVGFAIGLPPLWDTESGQSGIGIFGLMDQGSNNGRGLIPSPPDVWSRIYAGWDEPVIVKPGATIDLPRRSEDNVVQIDINDNEYFLIENRTNWFRTGVSIDSIRYLVYEQNEKDRYPPLVEVLFDSVSIEKDSNGVVTSIPDYDIGIPASGLLIWHVDENRINTGLANYSINGDRENRGVDLEEADGAQDIGYPNIFLFADPTSGYFGDMWFQGNPEYESLYPDFEGEPIEFTPFTYPNTKSNYGASTYLSINNIGLPGDTMSFSVTNAMLAEGFPDTSLHIGLVYDFDNDGAMEIVGGKDSLWVAQEGNIQNRIYFYQTDNEVYDFSIGTFDSKDRLIIFERDSNSTIASHFSWDSIMKSMVLEDQNSFNTAHVLFINDSTGNHQYLEDPQESSQPTWIINYDGSLDSLGRGTWISATDLNLDGTVEYLSMDKSGKLSAKHLGGISVSGFPLYFTSHAQPALTEDLYSDDHPEIVIQNTDSEIIIINWKGEVEYRLTNYGDLVCLGQYEGRNAIVTESAIWLFDDTSENYGNEWISTHHDFGNTRTLHLNIPKRSPDESLFDKDKTYAYPNPAYGGIVKLRIAVESAESVEIMIYDFAGYFVERFESDIIQSTIHEIDWNINDLESGVYFANVKVTKGNDTDNKILKIGIIK